MLRIILLIIFFIIFFNVLVADVLHAQTCTEIKTKSELSCQEEVTLRANNCKYVFLFWQKVKPSQKDIDSCIKYRNQSTEQKK